MELNSWKSKATLRLSWKTAFIRKSQCHPLNSISNSFHAILIDRKYLSNYIVQSSYCVYEIKLLTALLYKTLKQNERLLQTCQILKQNLIESLCALNMYINNIINEKNMRLKIEDNAR